MDNANILKRTLENIIQTHKLYGKSFTYGVALRIAMQNQWLFNDLDKIVEAILEDHYGEVLGVMQEAGMRISLYALAEVIDLSMLDEIARIIIGEDEE